MGKGRKGREREVREGRTRGSERKAGLDSCLPIMQRFIFMVDECCIPEWCQEVVRGAERGPMVCCRIKGHL